MVSIYCKFISEEYDKLYLPVSRRGKTVGEDVVYYVGIY